MKISVFQIVFTAENSCSCYFSALLSLVLPLCRGVNRKFPYGTRQVPAGIRKHYPGTRRVMTSDVTTRRVPGSSRTLNDYPGSSRTLDIVGIPWIWVRELQSRFSKPENKFFQKLIFFFQKIQIE